MNSWREPTPQRRTVGFGLRCPLKGSLGVCIRKCKHIWGAGYLVESLGPVRKVYIHGCRVRVKALGAEFEVMGAGYLVKASGSPAGIYGSFPK